MNRSHLVGAILLTILLAHAAPADARWFARGKQAKPMPSKNSSATQDGRQVVPLDRANIRKHFGSRPARAVNSALQAGRWKPNQKWLSTTGKKYGRLLIVSDMHPSTGMNPVTKKINPAEDFKPNLQEVDFRSMLKAQWKASAADKKVRTVVLNGDNFEFMQTTRTTENQQFKGKQDSYGPLNTPQNVVAKLDAIHQGHPLLFKTYAEHMARGNRIVLVPGNHDRQFLHPTVLKALRAKMSGDVADLLLRDKTFAAGKGKHSRKRDARAKARKIVADKFEFHPWFFVVGDVMARHGHETDKFNSFSTPLGSYYHAGAKNKPMEAALGDYIVKGVFNKVERRQPWTDNTTKSGAVAKAVMRANSYNPFKMGKLVKYLFTREGSPTNKKAKAKLEVRKKQDVARYVRDYGLLERANAIQPAGKKITEAQLVESLLRYEASGAKAALSNFGKGHGVMRRLGKLVTLVPAMFKAKKSHVREREMADILFRDFNVGTLVVGHDHTFRVEPRLVLDNKAGTVKRGTVLDASTWTDQLPEVRRDAGFTPTSRRGLVVVDFDNAGSHAKLVNYDPVRGLQKVNVLETEKEAQVR